MNNRQILLHLLIVILSCYIVSHSYGADMTEGMNAQQITAVIPTLQGHERVMALLHLARINTQKTDASPAEIALGIEYFKEVIASGETSLEILRARVQLASELILAGKAEEAKIYANSVIHADVNPIVKNEMPQRYFDRTKWVGTRSRLQGLTADSPEIVAAANKRIELAKQDINKQYLDIRHAALSLQAMQIFRESGLVGVQSYLESFRDDGDAKTCLQAFLDEKSKRTDSFIR